MHKKCDVFKTMSVYLLIFTHEKQTNLLETDRRLRKKHGDDRYNGKRPVMLQVFSVHKNYLTGAVGNRCVQVFSLAGVLIEMLCGADKWGPLESLKKDMIQCFQIPRKLGV